MKWKEAACLAGVCVVLLLIGMFGLMVTANEMSKEARSVVKGPDHAELTTNDGTAILCKAAEFEIDEGGTTLVSGDDGTKTTAKTAKPSTQIPLTEIDSQGDGTLANIKSVTFPSEEGKEGSEKGSVTKTVAAIEKGNNGETNVQFTDGTTMNITQQTTTVVDGPTNQAAIVQPDPAYCTQSRRILQGSLANKVAFTYEELVERYNHEISGVDVEGNRRRLETVDAEGLAAMARWFGAIFTADMSSHEANEQAMQSLIDRCQCNVASNPELPKMGTTGFTVWKLRQQFGAEADMGDTQLLFFGLKETPKFKLAQRVTHSFNRDEWSSTEQIGVGQAVMELWRGTISVTESAGGRFFEYEMAHPSHPVMGPLSYCKKDEELQRTIKEDPTGLMAAMHVLQNSYDDQKMDSKVSSAAAGDSEAGSSGVVLDDQMPFDCNNQRFRWRVDGWIVESTLNGTIVGLYAGDGGQYFEVVEVLDLEKSSFTGCSEKRSPMTCDTSSIRGADAAGIGGARGLSAKDWYTDSLAEGLQSLWEKMAAQTEWCTCPNRNPSGNESETLSCPSDVRYDVDDPKATLTQASRRELDFACHRYCHGRRMEEVSPIYIDFFKTSCENEKILSESTTDSVVQELVHYGQYWGCWDVGPHKCMKLKKLTNGRTTMEYGVCYGEFTRSGPTRFESILKMYGWDSSSQYGPRNQCSGKHATSPWTPGCTTEGDCMMPAF